MTNPAQSPENEKPLTLEDQLSPILHDDGKGLSICFHMDNKKEGTSFAIHMDAWYPEEGLPSFNNADLEALTVYVATEFAHIMWPDTVKSLQEMEGEDDSTEHPSSD